MWRFLRYLLAKRKLNSRGIVMNRRALSCVPLIVVALFLTFQNAYAQTPAASNSRQNAQDQALKEILDEVKQLRALVENLNSQVYRTQVLIERLRVRQTQVSRLNDELSAVRQKLADVRRALPGLREREEDAEKRRQAGMIPDSQVKAIKTALEENQRREQELVDEEARLANELATERKNVDDLNRRLDALELEIRKSSTK